MSFRPQILRTDAKSRYNYARGKYAVGICHRSGFKYPLKELKFEPGTNHFVHKSENDGEWSLVAHAQNFPPEKKIERIALRWVSPEEPMSIGTVVSADALFLPVFASVCNHWIKFPDGPTYTSSGSGVSGVPVSIGAQISAGADRLNFENENNSMYLLIVFQGI